MPHAVTSAESSMEDSDQSELPHTQQADLQNFPPIEIISLSAALQ